VDLPVGPVSSFVCSVSYNSSLEFTSLISWLAIRFRPVLSSSIVVNHQLFADLSSTIVLKDRGFVSVSSSVRDWSNEMKAEDGSVSSVSWIILYRASLSGFQAADFHQACDGMGKCVVVVKAENERVAAAYNIKSFRLIVTLIPTSRALLSLSLMMGVVERFSIEMIIEWEYGIILIVVMCFGMISPSQTIVTRTTFLSAILIRRMEQEGRN
jgi:hypothetical protein